MAAPTVESKPAPTISLKQNKKILKKKKKNVVRNLLAKPYEDYWPLPNDEELEKLQTAFEKILSDNEITITKEEDKVIMASKRKEYKRRKWTEHLVFGVNDVSRSTRKGSVIAVLLANDVDPKFMIQHVATLCGAFAIPVLAMPSLRNVTKQLLGFSTIALGLKGELFNSNTNELHEIYKLIKEINQNYPPPPCLRQFTKSHSRGSEHGNNKDLCRPDETKLDTDAQAVVTPSTDLYLYRTQAGCPAFVPPSQKIQNSEGPMEAPKEKVKLEDFISLGANSDTDDQMHSELPFKGISNPVINPTKKVKPEQSSPSFMPLTVIRVRANPNKKRKN